jgi:hypothetical protein
MLEVIAELAIQLGVKATAPDQRADAEENDVKPP